MKKFFAALCSVMTFFAACILLAGCGDHPVKGKWQRDDGEYYVVGVPETLEFNTDFFGRCFFSFNGVKAYCSSERETALGTEYYFSYSEKTGGGALFDPEVCGVSAAVRTDPQTGNLILFQFSSSKMSGMPDVSSREEMIYLPLGA